MKGQRILMGILLLGMLLAQAAGVSQAQGPTLSQSSPSQGEARVEGGIQADPGTCSATTPYCTNLVRNGGFETGDLAYWAIGWGHATVANIWDVTGFGSWLALLAYYNNDHNSIYQSFTCPFAAAGIRFQGWVLVSSAEESGRYDWLTLTVWSSGGFAYTLWAWNDFPNAIWTSRAFDYFPTGGLAPGQTWQVILEAQNDSSNPTTFSVDEVSLTFCCAEDQYEPNNTYDTAYYLVPGVTYEVRMCPNGDEDWFRFPVVRGQVITAELYNLPEDFALNLYSSPSRQLCANIHGTIPEYCQVIADSTGEWRVRVIGVGGSTSSSPALLRVQVADLVLQPTSTPTLTRTPTATPTPTATGQIRPTRTSTTTPNMRATGTLTPALSQRVFLPVIIK
ncbi:MAG: PPC domain-containing protein [Chloroflexi bacterium]|nr:PPC domain-containing protein [Chloroflexota bacterium]